MSYRGLALGLSAASGALAAGALVLLVLSWDAPVPDVWAFRGYAIIQALAFTSVGALIAVRRPANAIGWLLLSVGLVTAAQAFAVLYAEFTIVGRHPAWPFGEVGAWIGSWAWTLNVTLIVPLVLLRFPDGRLISPRWRWIERLAALATASLACYFILRPGPLQLAPYVDNPFAVSADWLIWLSVGSAVVGFPVTGAAAWSVVLRFRRSSGIERQQVKWLAFAAFPLVVTGFASAVLPDKVVQVLFVFLQALVPVAIGVAILRYRLYDIDAIISRTLAYAIITALLGGSFVAVQELLKRIFIATTGASSDLAVVLALFVIVTLFTPLRARVQVIVDRRLKPKGSAEAPASTAAIADALRTLAKLRNEGVLTNADFERKKQELLIRI